MIETIKINEKEFDYNPSCDMVYDLVKNQDLIEIRNGEFIWTKKHFVKGFLALSKIVPFPDKFKFYNLAFKIQFTDLYERWMNEKYPSVRL